MVDVPEICAAITMGEDVREALTKIEPQLKRFCNKREALYSYSGSERLCAEDALYELSPSIQAYWQSAYEHLSAQERYEALLRFVNAREQYIGASQLESIHILRQCGWTAADVMASYIHYRVKTSRLVLSPDGAAEAAKEDWDTALQLLEGKDYDIFFPFYHKGYQIIRQFEWIDFLYCFVGYDDEAFLRKTHKSKRLQKFCGQILEKLSHTPTQTGTSPKASDCPDFSIFQNALLQQKHLMHSAAGQKLLNGNRQNGYYVMSFHLVDERCGCGAALCFEPLNKSPDYDDTSSKAKGAYFYRFTHLYLSDYIPESRRQMAEDMPEDFAKRAYRAFSMLAGWGK